MKRLRVLALTLCWCGTAAVTVWAAAALYFDVRPWAAALYAVALLVLLWRLRSPWHRLGATCGAFLCVLAWWLTQRPAQERAWQPDVARTASAELNGDTLTIRNFRNCDYRTESDYTPRWEIKTVHLSNLQGVDLALDYWGSPWIAHPIVCFRFGAEGNLAYSIEIRKEVGESYSAVRGFFRQYELIYLVADERDVLRVRTNYRQAEDVYLYPLQVTPAQARARLLEYVTRVNALHAQPEWYHALTSNCTTAIRAQQVAAERAPWDWRIILNGKLDELLYERGLLERSLPFAELKERAHINERAYLADQAPDFSSRIRAAMPAPPPAHP